MVNCCCCCDRTVVRKGVWTPEEDEKLITYVKKYGHWNWRRLPKFAGLLRCGKSCRLRWMNYLRPDIRRGGFTEQEEETIIRLYAAMGGRWSVMAAQMPGRTDNDIKNHWNTVLKRRVMKQQKMLMANKLAETSPTPEVFPCEILSSNVNDGVMEQPISSTLIDLKAPEIALERVGAFPPAIQTPTAVNMDMSVDDDQFKSVSPQPPAISAKSGGDFWTDPLWLDSFDMPLDDHQPFGPSNLFTPRLDEYLWQEGILL